MNAQNLLFCGVLLQNLKESYYASMCFAMTFIMVSLLFINFGGACAWKK